MGWQHFAHSPGVASSEPPPTVPVIATNRPAEKFLDRVLTGVGDVTALNTATLRRMPEPIISNNFKEGQLVETRRAAGATRSEHLLGTARPAAGQARPRPGPPRQPEGQPQPVHPATDARPFPGAPGDHTIGANCPAQATIKGDQTAIRYAKTERTDTKLVAPSTAMPCHETARKPIVRISHENDHQQCPARLRISCSNNVFGRRSECLPNRLLVSNCPGRWHKIVVVTDPTLLAYPPCLGPTCARIG
jgi:hypothetical protein